MNTKHVISIGSVDFVHESWTFGGDITTTYVSMNYRERSTDHYNSDTVTEVDISKEDAQEIIKFLKTAYGI